MDSLAAVTSSLIVLGSVNRDLTVVVEHHPAAGETVLGGDAVAGTGGKGANQAAAAARSGVTPTLIASVGDDDAGRGLLAELSASGVDTSEVQRSDSPTGVALIVVAAGENTIVVAAGANARLEAAPTAERVRALTTDGTVLLAQLEIPLEVVEASAGAAVSRGGRFVLNLSPYRPVSAELLALCDPLVVNETEAAALVGREIDGVDAATAAARELAGGIRSVVLTLGGDGAVVARGTDAWHEPAPTVTVVDTTGAGDAFVGALSAGLATGDDLATAVRSGIVAGAEAVQYLGAQPPR